MSFSVSYDYESGRITISASGGPYYYRAICRTGTIGGSGEIVYDSLDDVGLIPLASGSSYTTSWFALDSETTYTANVLYYSTDDTSSYVGAMGGKQFTTPDAPPPTYNISATINYDANGGSGAPAAHRLTGTSASAYDYVSGTLSPIEPTRQGYRFNGWYLADTGQTYQASAAISVPGSTSGISYTLVAQWTQNTVQPYIYNGSAWVPAAPYVYNGSAWVPAAPQIRDGGSWLP